jgi:hypothetical protein
MKPVNIPKLILPLLLSASATLVSCTTRSSTAAAALKPMGGSMADLRSYQSATVVPFKMTGSHTADPGVGKRFAADIGLRLKNDFGPLFQDVRVKDQPLKKSGELVVTGTISKYQPGNRFARSVLIGLGAASFEAEMLLQDGPSGRQLASAQIDKLWAWGGIMGASKGIEEMMAESSAAAARTIADGKGWQPSGAR